MLIEVEPFNHELTRINTNKHEWDGVGFEGKDAEAHKRLTSRCVQGPWRPSGIGDWVCRCETELTPRPNRYWRAEKGHPFASGADEGHQHSPDDLSIDWPLPSRPKEPDSEDRLWPRALEISAR